MRAILVTCALLGAAAWPASAASRGSFSEALTAGSGPYIGNSLSAGFSPGPIDVDVGYDFGSDEDLVLFHSLWGSLGVWPVEGLKLAVDGDFGPKVSSDSPSRGHYAVSSGGVGGSILWHPGRGGESRPFLQVGAGFEHLDVEGGTTPGGAGAVNAAFDQTSISGTFGVDVSDTSLRFGASKFFYSEDAGALRLPPGIGGGPLGLGAVQGVLPTRAENWNVRASLRQRFGDRGAWDAQVRFTYAPYVDSAGSVTALNVRLGKDLTRNLRAFVGVTGQVEDLASSTFGLFGSAGVSVLF